MLRTLHVPLNEQFLALTENPKYLNVCTLSISILFIDNLILPNLFPRLKPILLVFASLTINKIFFLQECSQYIHLFWSSSCDLAKIIRSSAYIPDNFQIMIMDSHLPD